MGNLKGVVDIHNVRFYNLTPRSINCIKFNNLTGKVALSRDDSTIEIWDITYAPFLDKLISCEANKKYQIEQICWFHNRLFSGDLSGEIIEYNLNELNRKNQQYVTGNSIWCLDIHNQLGLLAAGTEEGYLNIFDLNDDNLMFKTVFDKQDGRILCCKFNDNGDYVVTGSIDVIRIWSTKTGHAIKKITMGRKEKKKETIVWTLNVLKNFSIISGDSRGQINVWDGNNGSLIETHQVFEKDIFTLAVNEEENTFMCAGVEPMIRLYYLTPIKKHNQVLNRWVKFLQRPVHDHDCKAVAFAGLKIISGGIDGFLGFSSHSRRFLEIKKYGPFLENPCMSVAGELRLLLLRYTNTLEIWRLGNPDENSSDKLLEMRSKNGDFITCAALSPNGKFLIYSTLNAVRLFKITLENGSLKLLKIVVEVEQFTPALKAFFSSDSNELYLCKNSSNLHTFSISENSVSLVSELQYYKQIKELLYTYCISKERKYLGIAGSTKLCIYQRFHSKWKQYVILPKHSARITAIQFNSDSTKLITAFSDGFISEFDLNEKKITNFKTLTRTDFTIDCIKNILFNNEVDDKFILQTENTLFSCQWSIDGEDDENIKKIKSEKSEASVDRNKLKVNLEKHYDNLIYSQWLSDGEIVIVGVNPVSLIEILPRASKRKAFGSA